MTAAVHASALQRTAMHLARRVRSLSMEADLHAIAALEALEADDYRGVARARMRQSECEKRAKEMAARRRALGMEG